MNNASPFSRPTIVRTTLFTLALAIVLGCAHLIFKNLLPGPKGMGPDYSFFFPELLSNYYAVRIEGWLTPPWFTPAFCGGQPAFADPQSIFYSVPQFLVAYFDPVHSVYGTLLIFIGAGFAGAYLFLRFSLGRSVPAAIVGATVFALNGFFSHRMLIGHLAFHGIMLTPWLALFLTMPTGKSSSPVGKSLLLGVAGAAVLAYWIVSGMAVLVIPAAMSVAALVLIHGIIGGSLRPLPIRAALSVVLGLGLAASKIAAALAYTAELPRTGYLLPGMSTVLETVNIAIRALFLSPENIAAIAAASMSNTQFRFDRHELEFTVTLVPAALAVIALISLLYRGRASRHTADGVNAWKAGLGTALALLLALPIAVNTFDPHWNSFLKSLPVIGSASNLFRWFWIFIPVLAVVSAIAFDKAFASDYGRRAAGMIAFAAVLTTHSQIDRSYYASIGYDPKVISAAFAAARKPNIAPTIRYIGANINSKGKIVSRGSNDLIVMGISQLRCYNPMFGYLLEWFPMAPLHPGSPLEVNDGRLNLKNPACYLFPKENGCVPGEHFAESRKDDAERFLHFQSHPFNRSENQKMADLATGLSLSAIPLIVMAGLFALRRGRRPSDVDSIADTSTEPQNH